jgi:tetratricopeptide (TPR) repeat protein
VLCLKQLVPLLLREDAEESASEALRLCKIFLQNFDLVSIPVTELLGATYHRLKDFSSALRVYESLISLTNSSLTSIENAATAADNAGRILLLIFIISKTLFFYLLFVTTDMPQIAEDYYRQALARSDGVGSANTWAKYGVFLKYRGKTAEAIVALQKAKKQKQKSLKTSFDFFLFFEGG